MWHGGLLTDDMSANCVVCVQGAPGQSQPQTVAEASHPREPQLNALHFLDMFLLWGLHISPLL